MFQLMALGHWVKKGIIFLHEQIAQIGSYIGIRDDKDYGELCLFEI